MRPNRFRFKSLEFDAESGEIRSLEGSESVQRLAPQPAHLLRYLIDRRMQIVSAEEIRELLWPDVRVEFEQSLHFCVRQIRAALGDSAADPRFIETVPRRGYRFIAEVEPVAARSATSVPEAEATHEDPPHGLQGNDRQGPTSRIGHLGPALLLLLALFASYGYVRGWLSPEGVKPLADEAAMHQAAPAPTRLGLMSFEDRDAEGRPVLNGIAERLLADLATTPGMELIGPTTTAAYEQESGQLRLLIEDYRLQYVLNGRMIEREDGTALLAELIRARDGAHVWVEAFEDLQDEEAICARILKGVYDFFDSGEP